MTSAQFCYWLQGFFEISGKSFQNLDNKQVDIIKKHLSMVFVHELDPAHGDQEHQNKLNEIHDSPGFPDLPSSYEHPQDPNGPTIYRC